MMSIYKRVENYSNLRGGIIRGDQVAVGDNPNAEQCTFLIKTTVRKKSSQLTNRFRAGYIEFAHLITFAGGGFLDRQDGTVKGTPVYVFNYDDALDVLVRKLTAVKQVKAYTDAMPLDKLAVLVRAVAERLSLKPRLIPVLSWAKRTILMYLPALSLADLESLVKIGDSLREQLRAGSKR